mgnify:CR=1 FL=1
MKLEDFKWTRKFRTKYRITLYLTNGRSMKVGFNSEDKANAALEFLQNLCETDENYSSVDMKFVPHRKGGMSYSSAKKKGRGYGRTRVTGDGPEELKDLFRQIFR